MQITIIGWYGSETIGDRAILAGIIGILSEKYTDFEIALGSIAPFFSQRVLAEDTDFHKQIADDKLSQITIFDSLNIQSLKQAVKNSDLLIMGGGPLMDINEMFMVQYAFDYARKKHIPSCVFGCGWGPLNSKEYINAAIQIVETADMAIFRDSLSLQSYHKAGGSKNITTSIDPAFFCADYYRTNYQADNCDREAYIAANFRDLIHSDSRNFEHVDEKRLSDLIIKAHECSGLTVRLVPQHTFTIGGDDRPLFNRLAHSIANPNVLQVINDPPSLVGVMNEYANAHSCIGMRFHSIVLQTVLNGRNLIIDYTDPTKGKIISVLNELNLFPKISSRYSSLHTSAFGINFDNFFNSERITVSHSSIEDYRDRYLKAL